MPKVKDAVDPVEAARIFEAAPDAFPLPPETVAGIMGFANVRPLDKQRFEGIGPKFIKVGRLVRYRAGDLRAYLEGRPALQAAVRRKRSAVA